MPRICLQRIAREAIVIEQEQARDAGALGYTARLLVQATMPHKVSPIVLNSPRGII